MYDGDTTAPSRSMIAFAFGPGRRRLDHAERSIGDSVDRRSFLLPARAARVVLEQHAAFRSSSRMPSAAAKSRRRRAAWRSSISRSISSTGTGGCSSSARRRLTHAEHAVELRRTPARTAATSRRRARRASIAEFRSRTRSNIAPARRRCSGRARSASERLARLLDRRLRRVAGMRAAGVHRLEPREEIDQPAQSPPRPGPCPPR